MEITDKKLDEKADCFVENDKNKIKHNKSELKTVNKLVCSNTSLSSPSSSSSHSPSPPATTTSDKSFKLNDIYKSLENPVNVNTHKAYRVYIGQFKKWLVNVKYKDGYPPNSKQFTEKDIVEYIKNITHNKTCKDRLLSVSSISMRIYALKYYYKKIYLKKLNSTFSRYLNEILNQHKKLFQKERNEKLHNMYGTHREYYTYDEFQTMCKKWLDISTNTAAFQEDLTFKKLDTIFRTFFDFLISYYCLLRSDNRNLARISHLYVEDLLELNPIFKPKLKVICLQKNQEKYIHDNEIKVTNFTRASNINICPTFAMSIYFYIRFDLLKEEWPNLNSRSLWYQVPLLGKGSTGKPVTKEAIRKSTELFLKTTSFKIFTKSTHLGRKSASTHAAEKSIDLFQISKQGGWQSEKSVMVSHYMFSQPITYLYRMFGHKFDNQTNFSKVSLERAILDFNSSKFLNISKKIFPWIELKFLVVLKCQKLENKNYRENIDLCLENAINMFQYLRSVLVEDMVEFMIQNPESHIFLKNTVFDCEDFRFLTKTVIEFKSDPRNFFNSILNKDSPLYDKEKYEIFDMDIIHHNLNELNEKEKNHNVTVKQLLELVHESNDKIKTIDLNLGVSTSLSTKIGSLLVHYEEMKNSMKIREKQLIDTFNSNIQSYKKEIKNLNEINSNLKKQNEILLDVTKNMEQNIKLMKDGIMQSIQDKEYEKKRENENNNNNDKNIIRDMKLLLKQSNEYTGPFYNFEKYETFNDLVKEWNEKIQCLNSINGNKWRLESGISIADYYNRKHCNTFIECLNSCIKLFSLDLNGCNLLMDFTNDIYYGNIKTFLNKLPIPKKFKNSEFKNKFILWLKNKNKIIPDLTIKSQFCINLEQEYIQSQIFK